MAGSTPKSQPRASVAGDTLTSRYQKALGAALGAVVAGSVLTAGEAKALVVNVGGLDYDVTTFIGNYNDNVSKFNTPANGGVMPWWGSSADAETFRDVVGASLGTPNNCGWAGVINCGPFFGYQIWGGASGSDGVFITFNPYPTGLGYVHVSANYDLSTWAQATLVTSAGSANVPGPLPILGVAAAFGFSRKLRKRIKLHKGTTAVSTPPGAQALTEATKQGH